MDFDFSMFDSIHTEPNIMGGQDIFNADGSGIGHTDPNIIGGHDFFSSTGEMIFQSRPNVMGGIDIDPLQSFNVKDIPGFDL